MSSRDDRSPSLSSVFSIGFNLRKLPSRSVKDAQQQIKTCSYDLLTSEKKSTFLFR